MKLKKNILEGEGDIKNIVEKIEKRDFSGNSGQAIKNSSWQMATTVTSKTGSLIFTVIVARLMLPEMYGLYGLALSTILFMAIFSDLGISTALTTYLSKTMDKNKGKARSYFYLLTKYKIALTGLSSLILLLMADWISNSFYNKPIYYALLAGAAYLPLAILSGYLTSVFISKNDFRPQFIREMIVQLSRIIVIPLSMIYFLRSVPVETYLPIIILLLSSCYGIGIIYLLVKLRKKNFFEDSKIIKLNKKEEKRLFYFILPLTATAVSGVFFGYLDQVMLGHYVDSKFLAFYQVAFNLISSASAIITVTSLATFPIFARLKGGQLERGFRKTRNITFLISIFALTFTFLAAPYIVKIIYGNEYSDASLYLRIFSLLLISFPLINLYTTYYASQEKAKIISILLIASTILNIFLNYILINVGLKYSMAYAVAGACLATILSRYFYLAGLVLWRKK